jgi:hypothetical protein
VIEKAVVGTTFFGPFPSCRMPKAKKDVNVHSFIYSYTISLMQQFLVGGTWKVAGSIPDGVTGFFL